MCIHEKNVSALHTYKLFEFCAIGITMLGIDVFLMGRCERNVIVTPDVQVCYVLQIKICAEYRDMLPRPRLVCQEPRLRPIGRSPGVPGKSSRGLGSMFRYSAQILICFIAYYFHFLILLWVWLGTLQDCQYAQCPLPLSIVIRMRLVIRQSKLPACLAEVQLAHQNTFWHLCLRLVKLTDKMDEICINGKFSVQESSEWKVVCIPMSKFTVFQPRI